MMLVLRVAWLALLALLLLLLTLPGSSSFFAE